MLYDSSDKYSNLSHRLYATDDGFKAQLEFAQAIMYPDLIEIVKQPKYKVRVRGTNNSYYYKNADDEEIESGIPRYYLDQFEFTDVEIKEHGLPEDMKEPVDEN